jgi:hypothetical protein
MLDPEQVAELERMPFLVCDALTGTTMSMSHPPSSGLPLSKNQRARSSSSAGVEESTTTKEDESYDNDNPDDDDSSPSYASPHASQYKTSGTTTEENLGMSPDKESSPYVLDDSPPPTPTDNKVSKFSFYDWLKHYMEGSKITESNRAAVETWRCAFLLRLELLSEGWFP